MIRTFTLLIVFLTFSQVFCQLNSNFGDKDSHTFFVEQLSKSKDFKFQEILSSYDLYIRKNPQSIIAKIERCKFISNSYLDEYEGYNLKQEETESCISSLLKEYPYNPKVLIYVAENRWGDERLEVLEKAKEMIDLGYLGWSDSELAEIYRMHGEHHEENISLSLFYFNKAQKLNDKLDLSFQIAEIYQKQLNIEAAKEILIPNLYKDTLTWVQNQKANLLLKLDEPNKALELFELIREKDSTYIDNDNLAETLNNLGQHEEARKLIVKDTLSEWTKNQALQRLAAHDLKYSESNTALETYRLLQRNSAFNDLFGIKRLQIFFYDPFLNWNPREVFHLSLLWVLFVISFLMPYLWIMPLYGLGRILLKSGFKVNTKLNFPWRIEHFWIISAIYILAQIITLIVFEYQETLNLYFDLVSMYIEDEIERTVLADEMILFVGLMAVGTLSLLNKSKLKFIFSSSLRIRQMIGLAILFVLFNRFFIKILRRVFDIEEPSIDFSLILSVEQEIFTVISQNGLGVAILLTAVIVPIYEEIIFRGIILGASEKYIGFKAANVLQAILFAALHESLGLFLFFFVFALIVGYWVRKSKGLLTGIIFHVVHNLVIVLALYYLYKIGYGTM